MAQEKKDFTLDDLMPGGNNYFNLQPQNAWYDWWGDNTCIKLGIDKIEGIKLENNINKGSKTYTIITLEEVNSILKGKKLGEIRSLYNVSFPKILSNNDKKHNEYAKLMLLSTTTHKVLIDWGKKQLYWDIPLNRKGVNNDWSKESKMLAFTVGNNLYVTTDKGVEQQVTNEPEGIVCGQEVHRNEFGIKKGTFWSPNGSLLAFYRMDQSMVTDYPQVDISKRVAELIPDKYPMAGMTSHKVTVGIYNPTTKKTIYLNAGDPTDRYFTNISWSPDEKSIYMIELNRDQNHSQLIRYNALTGEKENILIDEKHPKYVEPQHPIVFLPWDKNKFIYQSQKDGFNHLYLYDINGKLIKQLTKGNWLVQNIIGFNIDKKDVLIESTEISPLQTNIFSVNIASTKRNLIGHKDANHSVQLSATGKNIIDRYTSFTIPRKISIISTSQKNGKKNNEIDLLDASSPLEKYNMPEITIGTMKAADGKTDLYYRMVKPVGFDPNKKYPAIVYLYGGPHAQLIKNVQNYGAGGWDIYMAQKGYVMFTIDNRGSDNRGLEFENCTFRKLGTEEMKDQIKGVEYLKSLPYVDNKRLGVHGWSFGGFMTTNIMLTYPDVFKVAVAGGPVIDWKYYEIMYGERYMDTPQSNPEGYKNADLNLRAGNLKGRLKIIIGGNDPVCVPQHSLSFLRACIDAGTHPDFFIYPGDGHNMTGKDRVHLYEHVTRYFEDHLK